MVFPLSMSSPGSKVTEFAIIPVIGQPHLRTNEENFLVVNDDSTVVDHILVDYRPVNWSTGEIRETERRVYIHPNVTNDALNLLRP